MEGHCRLPFVVGGLGFEFCVFVAGWRYALFGVSGLLLLLLLLLLLPSATG